MLYKFVRRILVRDGIEWQDLYTAAGIKGSTGAGYEDNFRHGTIGRQNAALIYRWFIDHAPESTPDLHGELFERRAQASGENWAKFLHTYGAFQHADIHLVPKRSLGIVGFARKEPVRDQPIRLGERFVFRITSTTPRTIVCLQGYDDDWYVLPLSRSNHWVHLPEGTHTLPPDQDGGTPDPLSEDTHAGLHRFVLLLFNSRDVTQLSERLTVGHPIAPNTLNEIAGMILSLKADAWEVLRVNAQFKP